VRSRLYWNNSPPCRLNSQDRQQQPPNQIAALSEANEDPSPRRSPLRKGRGRTIVRFRCSPCCGLVCNPTTTRISASGSTVSKSNTSLAQIIGGHLDVDLIPHADTDKMFAHLARNMRQDLMSVGQCHAKHGSWQNLSYRPDQFNWLFRCHFELSNFSPSSVLRIMPGERAKNLPQAGRKSSGFANLP